MAIPTPLVEIGFDITGANANFFTLDSATKGRLDNSTYKLSGTIFYDVTNKVRSVAVRRGKSRQIDEFDAGLLNVVFDNNDRTFDPEFTNSPYAGQIIPKRAIRITSGERRIFTGSIDDWNLNYSPGGDSIAAVAASDGFSQFNTQTLPAGTATAQLTGARINAILNLSDVNWPTQDRAIDAGTTQLGADVYPENGNVLDYLRTVAKSEPGNVFMNADNHLTFTDRLATSGVDYVGFADDGTGISYFNMQVVYGSELLFNEIVIGSQFAGTAVAQDVNSIGEYGVLTLSEPNLLMSDPDYLANLVTYLAIKYGEPEYRFESIDVILNNLTNEQQQKVLNLELGDFVTVKFTPNGIPPAIRRAAEVIRITHDITPEIHTVSIGLATADKSFWTLSDAIFGRLSEDNVLGF